MAIFAGTGSVLQLKISSTYTTIAELQEFSGPSISVNMKEINRVADTWKDFQPTSKDGGDCSFSMWWNPTDETQAAVHAALGVVSDWKIVCSNASNTEITFSGTLNKFEPKGFAQDDYVMIDGGIKVRGAVTVTVTPEEEEEEE